MTQLVGVRLTSSAFSCVVWVPFVVGQLDTAGQVHTLLGEVATAIHRVAPDLLEDMQVSELLVSSPIA